MVLLVEGPDTHPHWARCVIPRGIALACVAMGAAFSSLRPGPVLRAMFFVDFVTTTTTESEGIGLDWDVRVRVVAIDKERAVKVVPFLYLSKDAGLEAVPFGIALDKEETNGEDGESSVAIHGVKVVQKTLHTEESYQTFEFSKKSADLNQEGDFGVFALNINDTPEAKIWQPDIIM